VNMRVLTLDVPVVRNTGHPCPGPRDPTCGAGWSPTPPFPRVMLVTDRLADRPYPTAGKRAVAVPIVWKEITTAFQGRMIGRSYAVEDGIVRVRTPLGEKTAELKGANSAFVAWQLLREMAAEGKA